MFSLSLCHFPDSRSSYRTVPSCLTPGTNTVSIVTAAWSPGAMTAWRPSHGRRLDLTKPWWNQQYRHPYSVTSASYSSPIRLLKQPVSFRQIRRKTYVSSLAAWNCENLVVVIFTLNECCGNRGHGHKGHIPSLLFCVKP